MLRVILIGGPSHAGKSTLAAALTARLGRWRWLSTDTLARHPGRPWGEVGARPHVAEHYLSLSPDELIEDVLRHYADMWPGVRDLIEAHASDTSAERLVLEGSALWPESVAELRTPAVAGVWLTADNDFLRERIFRASGHAHAAERERIMIEKFAARNHRYNERMMRAVRRLGLPWLDVERTPTVEVLADRALDLLRIGC